MNIVKKYAVKALLAAGIFTPAIVMADGFDASAIGTQVANVIMGFCGDGFRRGYGGHYGHLGNPRLQDGLEHDTNLYK
ncbi:hypothetical protein NMEN3081_1987 [Neisseria meningitidis NM3081]|nr:hypothetical protein NMEN3081_1987 [Neisseria meningitidis NM3081]